MRPVGPESSETYWMRRALVVGAMLVLLIIVLLFLVNLGGSPGRAAPGGGSTPTPPSTASTADPTSGPATPSTTPSPTDRASSVVSSPTPERSGATRSASPKASSPTSSGAPVKTSARHSTSEPSAAQPISCTPKELRPTLRGDRRQVTIGSKVSFRLSLINGSEQPCLIKITPQNFELKIYSGTDRIWSSEDCARLAPSIERSVEPERDVAWTMTWNGKRSTPGDACTAPPQLPRPGYYYATAQLKGARPVQFLMILQ